MYLILILHAIYNLFLNFAIWLPASSFWKTQEIYSQVLGRSFIYVAKSSFFLWTCALLPIRFAKSVGQRYSGPIFLVALFLFCLLDVFSLNFREDINISEIIVPLLIFSFLNIFYQTLYNLIKKIERIERTPSIDIHVFGLRVPNIIGGDNKIFKYHHILFYSSIVFFIAKSYGI